MLQNVDTALGFLKRKNVKLVNIRPDDITDGNPKLTLGLIWTIILHFQVSVCLSKAFMELKLLIFATKNFCSNLLTESCRRMKEMILVCLDY